LYLHDLLGDPGHLEPAHGGKFVAQVSARHGPVGEEMDGFKGTCCGAGRNRDPKPRQQPEVMQGVVERVCMQAGLDDPTGRQVCLASMAVGHALDLGHRAGEVLGYLPGDFDPFQFFDPLAGRVPPSFGYLPVSCIVSLPCR
jgi:hypothetical protein